MPFQCKKCNKVFKCQRDLTRHLNGSRPCIKPVLKCEKCGYETTILSSFKQHQQRKTPCNTTQEPGKILDKLNRLEEKIDDITSESKKQKTKKTEPQEQYIYVIQEREFVKDNQKIYKIGKTTQDINIRVQSYPKNSVLKYLKQVDDCNFIEKQIIKEFDKLFVRKPEYGREYYEGDIKNMTKEIEKITDLPIIE